MTGYQSLQQAIRAGMADRAVPRWAAAALHEVTTGRNPITAVRHPLGFLCLPLERAGEQGVCVHVWTDQLAQATPTTTTMHSHSWDLVSFVLYGTLCNEVLDVTDSRPESTCQVFEVDSGPGGDELRRTGRLVGHRTATKQLHRRGQVYSLPAGVFHRTSTLGEAATVALGRGHPGTSDLVLGAADTATHRVRRQACDREETVRVATLVVQRLSGITGPWQQHAHDGGTG